MSLQLFHMFINVVLFLLCMRKSTALDFRSVVVVVEDGNNITTTKCIESERQSLLMFKENLIDSYGRLSSWGSEEDKKDCCKWSGVHCNRNGHVIKLNLSAPYNSKLHNYSSLRGKINPSLLQLRHLRYLDLSYNDFGSTPIPKFIGSLAKLNHLDLSHSSLGGIIPRQLGNLSKLYHLDLGYNAFNNNSLENIDWLSRLSSLTHLSLAGNQLVGVIPNSISFRNLCNLKTLDLLRNNLNGTLSSLLNDLACAEASLESLILTSNELTGSLNDDITRFSSLRKLSLDNNRLNGFLPNALGKLSELQHLDVSFNSLHGVISKAHFSNLTKLKYLDLSVNTFSFKLSSQWITPFQLDTIILASCDLGPRFPKWLQTQTQISHLNLSNSQISDIIPSWFWDRNQSTQLQLLDLSSNKLRGMLPADLSSKFAGYPLLDLSSNYFVGPVPKLPSRLAILNLSQNKFMGRLTFLCSINRTLTFLDLSDNLLSGGLPGCLEYFRELIVLNLAHNKLSGKIPSFGSSLFHRLETLVLRNNSFFGEFPSTFWHCTFLSFLDLGENKLSGNIPAWIGENLLKLYVLSLRSNKFNGSIPLQLCHLTKLHILDLSQNSLSGSIPRCFDNFTAMADQHMPSMIQIGSSSSYVSDNYVNSVFFMMKGVLHQYRMIHKLLFPLIDLSRNKLTGEFPEEITNLGLLGLNLSSNELYGVIPQKIGHMNLLESLDLSRNNFSGEIPPSMVHLTFLAALNLSYNNFSGRIPEGNQFLSFEDSSYFGNSGLCGIPLSAECRKDDIINGGGNKEFGRWFCMVIALGFSTGFWEFVAVLLRK